jgi:hypothetical protein
MPLSPLTTNPPQAAVAAIGPSPETPDQPETPDLTASRGAIEAGTVARALGLHAVMLRACALVIQPDLPVVRMASLIRSVVSLSRELRSVTAGLYQVPPRAATNATEMWRQDPMPGEPEALPVAEAPPARMKDWVTPADHATAAVRDRNLLHQSPTRPDQPTTRQDPIHQHGTAPAPPHSGRSPCTSRPGNPDRRRSKCPAKTRAPSEPPGSLIDRTPYTSQPRSPHRPCRTCYDRRRYQNRSRLQAPPPAAAKYRNRKQ